MSNNRLPVYVLSGFLGSGKTTLLHHWLKSPEFGDTAVIVNEAGAVQIDGVLVGHASENIRIIEGGCVCCTVLDDLGETLAGLLEARADGRIPSFSRIVIETSGLANPAPVAASLFRDARVAGAVRHGGSIAVVDGLNGQRNLARFDQARAQVRHADWIIVTKAECLDAAGLSAVKAATSEINPHAPHFASSRNTMVMPNFLSDRPFLGKFRPSASEAIGPLSGAIDAAPGDTLKAHAFSFKGPVDGVSVIEALDLMEQVFEGQIVRSKSLFRDTKTGLGFVVHCVQGVLDQPEEVIFSDETQTGVVVFTHSDYPDYERLMRLFLPFVAVEAACRITPR